LGVICRANEINGLARRFKSLFETVRVKNEFVSGHIRVPAYIRGKTGTIVHVSPATVVGLSVRRSSPAAASP
jgi:hypothetical protein